MLLFDYVPQLFAASQLQSLQLFLHPIRPLPCRPCNDQIQCLCCKLLFYKAHRNDKHESEYFYDVFIRNFYCLRRRRRREHFGKENSKDLENFQFLKMHPHIFSPPFWAREEKSNFIYPNFKKKIHRFWIPLNFSRIKFIVFRTYVRSKK